MLPADNFTTMEELIKTGILCVWLKLICSGLKPICLKGDLAAAAADINVVRTRANATPVVAGDVNMDLILDERARELYMEEFRLSTLMRTGKLIE